MSDWPSRDECARCRRPIDPPPDGCHIDPCPLGPTSIGSPAAATLIVNARTVESGDLR